MAGLFGLAERHIDDLVPPKRLVEFHPALDIHALYRQGALTEGASVTLQLGDGGSLRASRKAGNLSLEGGQLIPVRPHPSLPMPVWGCPKCETDRYKLYLVDGVWACRDCHSLTWISRHRGRSIPGLNRLRWLRKRLRVEPTPFTPLPEKPLYALRHWRLAREIRRLEERLLAHARGDVAAVLERRYAQRRRDP
jgi:hypothetical protein